jgi:protein TonB
LALHLAFAVALVLAVRQNARAPSIASDSLRHTPARLVWLNDPGPGGGGGGGGDRMTDPPRRAEAPGHDAVTVAASPPRASDFSRPATIEPDPVPQLLVPVAALASAIDALPKAGAIDVPPSPSTLSQGPGDGGGTGTGKGAGDGPGRGPGLGEGDGGGTGGGFFHPGGDVTMPVEIQKGTPHYTTEAMRARIQGSITVQCVVETTGACERIRVLRSFDPAFGLDQEAIKAAAQWRFRPGRRRGEPVPVMVTMEIAFALR